MRQELSDGGFVDISPQAMDDPVEQLVREVEAHADARWGWDARPVYMAFFRTPFMFEAFDIGWLPDQLHENPGMYLPGFVEWFGEKIATSPDLKGLRERFAPVLRPDFLGIAVVFEGWAITGERDPDETIEATEERLAGTLRPSQHPDRKEMRGVTAVTVDGEVFSLQRIRGQFPELAKSRVEERGISWSGRIPEAMVEFCGHIQRLATTT